MTQIMATWKLLDVNDDGAVSVNELVKALVPFGESEEKVAQMINVADENGNGTVPLTISLAASTSAPISLPFLIQPPCSTASHVLMSRSLHQPLSLPELECACASSGCECICIIHCLHNNTYANACRRFVLSHQLLSFVTQAC